MSQTSTHISLKRLTAYSFATQHDSFLGHSHTAGIQSVDGEDAGKRIFAHLFDEDIKKQACHCLLLGGCCLMFHVYASERL